MNCPYEILCFDVYFNASFTRFICVYLPPNQRDNVIIDLCNTLKSFLVSNAPLFILGDFNFPHIDWKIPSCLGNSSNRIFLDFCSYSSLTFLPFLILDVAIV